MSNSKIASRILYILLGISVVVLLNFYISPKLVDQKAYDAKVAKIGASSTNTVMNVTKDLQAADSLGTSADSSAVDSMTSDSSAMVQTMQQNNASMSSENTPAVHFNFFEKLDYYRIDIALTWGYILILITALIALVFPAIYMFTNPTNMVKTLIILVVIAVLIGIAYLLSSDTPLVMPGYTGTDNTNPVVLRRVDTGLIFMYFALGLAVLSILYSEIAKYFK